MPDRDDRATEFGRLHASGCLAAAEIAEIAGGGGTFTRLEDAPDVNELFAQHATKG